MFHDPGPPWLDNAHRASEALQATTRKARGAGHSVYVVLLHDARRAEPWGLYVGHTSRDPDLGGNSGTGYPFPASSAARRISQEMPPFLRSIARSAL